MKKIIFMVSLFTACLTAAQAAHAAGKPVIVDQACDISGTNYSLIMQLMGEETKDSFTGSWARLFRGHIWLLEGGRLIARLFPVQGSEGYDGKHFYYYISGKNSAGKSFHLWREHPANSSELTLKVDVGSGIHLVFDERDLRCGPI